MYHGWADPGIAPENSVNYFTSVEDTVGGKSKAADSIRLFMVPGMGHCAGGDGTDDFDKIGALAQWVETGKAPDHIPAAHKTPRGGENAGGTSARALEDLHALAGDSPGRAVFE